MELSPTDTIIRESVGAGGTNRSNDVALVVLLLNDHREGERLPLLAPRPDTDALADAIRAFEAAERLAETGLFQPRGAGIRRLAIRHLARVEANPALAEVAALLTHPAPRAPRSVPSFDLYWRTLRND